MKTIFLALAAAACLAACASYSSPDDAAADSPSAFSAQAQRGRIYAERECAGCHAIDMVGSSPQSTAPPFHTIRIRYNAISWERELARIAAGEHFAMPPLKVDEVDARDLHRFIETLGPAG